jgi:cytoskeletal protein CcmA (bactofilin family)
MFGKKGGAHLHMGSTTLVSKATEVVGDVHFSGHLNIEGVVRGNIVAQEGGHVSIANKGRVIGNIHAPTIIINGDVEGDVHSVQHLELGSKAHVKGNVYYHFLEVVKGAQVNGNMVFDGEESAADRTDAQPEPVVT